MGDIKFIFGHDECFRLKICKNGLAMSDNKAEGSSQEQQQSEEVDKDLSQLLESVLQDFSTSDKETPKASTVVNTTKDTKEKPESAPPAAQEWSEDFIKQAAEQFESNIAALLGDTADTQLSSEQIQASFKQMAEAAQQALANPDVEQGSEFAQTISQTIQGLSQGAENLQAPFSENDIMNMFGNLGDSEQNSFLPFMQGMMQNLLSKDVLYPSLKDIIGKYPAWLEENDAKLTAEDRERYGKQLELMKKVCEELETEKEDDGADVRKQRFEKVLALMQTLQDYGQPPTDIVSESDSALPLMDQNNLAADQCSIM